MRIGDLDSDERDKLDENEIKSEKSQSEERSVFRGAYIGS